MKKTLYTSLLVGIVSLLLGLFFLNPWALDAALSKNLEHTGSHYWYWTYHVEPRILDRHPDKFPIVFQTLEDGTEYYCRNLEIIPIGSVVYSRCLGNGNVSIDPVFGIFDPAFHWRLFQNSK